MFGNRSNERGFTLLETMIAGGMLVAGVVGLMGLQVVSINGARFGNRSSQSLMFAKEMAAKVQSRPWAVVSTYPTADDSGQPDGFKTIDPLNDDPSSGTPAFTVEGMDINGTVLAAYNSPGAVYQRIVQVRGEETNAASSGIDLLRVKVTVRFRDTARSTRWRDASIIVVRNKLL